MRPDKAPSKEGDKLASIEFATDLNPKIVEEDDPEAKLSNEILGELVEDKLTIEFGEIVGLFLSLRTILAPLGLIGTLLVVDLDARLMVLEVLLILVKSREDFSALSPEWLTKFKEGFRDWVKLTLEGPALNFFNDVNDFWQTTLPAKAKCTDKRSLESEPMSLHH